VLHRHGLPIIECMKKAKVTKDRKAAAKLEVSRSANRESLPRTNFRLLLGIGLKVPMNPKPKFTTEDQLWEKDVD
jgi:hypothetical protein